MTQIQLSPHQGQAEVSAIMLKENLILPSGQVTNCLMIDDNIVAKDGKIINANGKQRPTHKIVGAFHEPEYKCYNILAANLQTVGKINVLKISENGELFT